MSELHLYRPSSIAKLKCISIVFLFALQLDANGKKNSWECVAVIPFLNQTELVRAVGGIDHMTQLTTAERLRNIPGEPQTFRRADSGRGSSSPSSGSTSSSSSSSKKK